MPSIIGFGKCSKYYLYLLGAVVGRSLKDTLFGFTSINPEGNVILFDFIPQLSKHILIQSLYRYISFIIGGLLFSYIIKQKIKKKNENEINSNKSKIKGLIHNKNYDRSENIPYIPILITCSIFCIHNELIKLLYLFDLYNLDFWTIDILFILLFMDKYFIINLYKHQKYSIIFILITNTVLLLISSFLPYTKHDEGIYLTDYNTFKIIEILTGNYFYFLLFLALFITLSCSISYSRVKTKVIMDFNYISPYKMIFFIGVIGTILISISLTCTSFISCSGDEKYIKFYCIHNHTEDNNNYYYYDNIFNYIDELNNNLKTYQFYLEVLLITPLFLIINFLEFTCEILIIYYLNPNYVLIRDNLYYGFTRAIFVLINENYEEYIALNQFIILELTEFLALLGYLVYLEIIELRFCELNKDIKQNIIDRGKRETISKPLENSFDSDDNSDEENNENENENDNENDNN